jgi:hypothetical protein
VTSLTEEYPPATPVAEPPQNAGTPPRPEPEAAFWDDVAEGGYFAMR